VTDPHGTYGLPFASREFQDELYVMLGLGPEHRRRCALECATPVLEHGSRRRSVDGNGLEKGIKFVKRDVGWRE